MASARLYSEQFANVDAAWLHMEQPTNMATITGVMIFDRPIDIRRLEATVEHRMLKFDRLRQRVREPAFGIGLPRWEMDPFFDRDAHLHRIALPAPGGMRALQALVSDLMSTPLDFSKPLWQMHLIENVNQGCAIVLRIHHCIGDGVALVKVLLDMTDKEADAPWPGSEPAPEAPARSVAPWQPLGPLFTPAVSAVGNTVATAGELVSEGMDYLIHPSRFVNVAKLGLAGVLAAGKLGLSLPDRQTLFRGTCGVTKRAVWCEPVKLNRIKAIGKAMGSTVNDVLLAAVSGALRRYMVEAGEQIDPRLSIRAMVPVSIRRPHEIDQLNNRFGLVLLSLPIGIEDPLERLLVLKRRMDTIKGTPEAAVAFGILGIMGLTPIQIEKLILDFFVAKSTAVMTNVPGPRQVLYYAGAPMRQMIFWVPTPGHLGLGLSIFSYAGEVSVGFATDCCLVPDPEKLVDGFHAELAEMERWIVSAAPTREAPSAGANGRADLDTRGTPQDATSPAGVDLEARLTPPTVGVTRSVPSNGRGHPVEIVASAQPTAISGDVGDGRGGAPPPAAAVVASVPAATAVLAAPAVHRCTALTISGEPCRNRALPGSNTCRVHTRQG
jgi:diacylglycerol O-acyltransferase / wax synthase